MLFVNYKQPSLGLSACRILCLKECVPYLQISKNSHNDVHPRCERSDVSVRFR